jgi:hypothetical protein
VIPTVRTAASLSTIALAFALAFGSLPVLANPSAGRASIDEARLDPAALEQAALQALQGSAEALSNGQGVAVEIVDLRVTPDTFASVAVDGVGRLRVEQGDWIPMRFTGGYDVRDAALFGLRVLPISSRTNTASTQVDQATVERVNGQVASQILAEFPDQPAEIVFIDLQPSQDARGHVVFRGTGLVDFADEGSAPVQFSALMDRASGLVVSMDYQLDVAGGHGNATAIESIAAR